MASQKLHNGGGTGPFSFDFPSLEESDIKVTVSGNPETGFSINNYDPVTGGEVNIPGGTAGGTDNVRIFRQTEPETLAATFVTGSSISANDLNNCNKQTIFLADENKTAINNLALGNAASAVQISGSNIADNSISSSKILDLEVKTADINNLAVTTGKIADDAVTADKLANSINTTIAGKANTGANLSTFTNDTNYITLAQAFTTGMIIMWSGAISNIPSGWVLCDGNNNTPNLRDKFIVGAGNNYAVAATGGEDSVTLTTAQIPSHTHSIQIRTGVDDNNFSFNNGFSSDRNDSGGTFNSNSTGGGQSHENRPPYYALAFIMKT